MAIYLDHNATSPMHPEVADAMMPFLRNPTGNPSSLHSFGRMARSAVESARAEVANLLGCSSDAVIFTSGGTEANNMLLKGYVDRTSERPVVSSEIEHPSILEPLRQLQADGQAVVLLKPDYDGLIDLAAADKALSDANAQLLTIIYANNETGVIQPVKELAAMVDRDSCLVHSDATQAVGKIPIDMAQIDIDAISFSAHKLRGPQGVGALVVNRKPRNVLISGGYQENRLRGGTENVAGIVGLGKAAQVARLEMAHKKHHLEQLRDVFEAKLEIIPGSVVFGQQEPRLPNTTFFALPYYHGETLLMELDRAGFALSSGSACHSAVTKPSHVLTAMGVDDGLALNAIRVSFGMDNSLQDVEMLVTKLQELVNQLPAVIRQVAV
ncbi:MAG: cysteine desulfurase [Gammaproteobacteria bacterium]|nr:cysteine desulfurase [Gammaproteobacteria bacterium]MDH3856808.1 cysteine desulfurase [Gammaproteobacteria bacterium]